MKDSGWCFSRNTSIRTAKLTQDAQHSKEENENRGKKIKQEKKTEHAGGKMVSLTPKSILMKIKKLSKRNRWGPNT